MDDKNQIRAYCKSYSAGKDCTIEWGFLTYRDAQIATRWLHHHFQGCQTTVFIETGPNPNGDIMFQPAMCNSPVNVATCGYCGMTTCSEHSMEHTCVLDSAAK